MGRGERVASVHPAPTGIRLNCWKMKPSLFSRMSLSLFSRIFVSSVSLNSTDPELGRSSPAAHWRKVRLPDPDGPITAVKLPLGKVMLTPRRACTVVLPRP